LDISVYYRRLDPERGTSLYTEGLVDDDGRRLKTYTVIPAEHRARVSGGLWRLGLLPRMQTLTSIQKYYFYAENFDLLVFFDQDHALAGYYSDVTTPLTRAGADYHLTDLFLDVWITPAGQFHELDWDEFDTAIQAGHLTPELAETARATLRRLRAEFQAGRFPSAYLD
jgi:protein associated with RNAse G/E